MSFKTKVCSACNERKSISEYWKSSRANDGLQYNCKPCQNKAKIRYYHTTTRNTRYRKEFGITLAQFNMMLKNQGSKCAICYTKENECGKNFVVDHDHKTGKVRGLLCDKCNRVLGSFKDSIDLFKQAIEYLENH